MFGNKELFLKEHFVKLTTDRTEDAIFQKIIWKDILLSNRGAFVLDVSLEFKTSILAGGCISLSILASSRI